MPTKYNRYNDINPVNTLKKAVELENLEKYQPAIDVIINYLRSGRIYNITSNDGYENLLSKYIDLSLKVISSPRFGLRRYKIICMQSSTPHVHLNRIYEKLLIALDNYEAEEIAKLRKNADDKEFFENQYYSERLNFQWNSYLEILENIRGVTSLIDAYQNTAQRAICFCTEFKRTKELKKLHEFTNKDILYSKEHQRRKDSVNINDSSVVKSFLAVKFSLLESYIVQGNFEKGLEIIEEVKILMKMPKGGINSISPSFFLPYFEALSQFFWDAKMYFLHALTLYRFFTVADLSDEIDETSIEIIKKRIVLAVLAIPNEINDSASILPRQSSEFDAKISELFDFFDYTDKFELTKTGLLGEIQQRWADICESAPFNQLIYMFETDFSDITKTDKYSPEKFASEAFEDLAAAYEVGNKFDEYNKLLEKRLIVKTLSIYSQYYSKVPIRSLAETLRTNYWDLESILLGSFDASVDFEQEIVIFENYSQENEIEFKNFVENSKTIYLNIICLMKKCLSEENKALLSQKITNLRQIDDLTEITDLISKIVSEEKQIIKEEIAEKETQQAAQQAAEKDEKTLLKDDTAKDANKDAKEAKIAKVAKVAKEAKPVKTKKELEQEKAQKKQIEKQRIDRILELQTKEKELEEKNKYIRGANSIESVKKLREILSKLKKGPKMAKKYLLIDKLKKKADEKREEHIKKWNMEKQVKEDFTERCIRIAEAKKYEEQSTAYETTLMKTLEEYKNSLLEEKSSFSSLKAHFEVAIKSMKIKHSPLVVDQKQRKQEHDEKRKKYLQIVSEQNKKLLEEKRKKQREAAASDFSSKFSANAHPDSGGSRFAIQSENSADKFRGLRNLRKSSLAQPEQTGEDENALPHKKEDTAGAFPLKKPAKYSLSSDWMALKKKKSVTNKFSALAVEDDEAKSDDENEEDSKKGGEDADAKGDENDYENEENSKKGEEDADEKGDENADEKGDKNGDEKGAEKGEENDLKKTSIQSSPKKANLPMKKFSLNLNASSGNTLKKKSLFGSGGFRKETPKQMAEKVEKVENSNKPEVRKAENSSKFKLTMESEISRKFGKK